MLSMHRVLGSTPKAVPNPCLLIVLQLAGVVLG
ncbi:hypothetical protein Cadr_000016341 [Camelus dromedarius]|uniref:Uncharacterized protein n=1 Tax=Camelus dromedarius TaxID=9838 RepID=A0A5N4E9D2_CAMDR|nr:hypothetical protein Cadr_000016341 [Camelus dromedarius]